MAATSTFVGGVNAVPGQVVEFTQVVRPGTYHLIDSSGFFTGADDAEIAVRTITVAGDARSCAPTGFAPKVYMVDGPAGPRYLGPNTFLAGEPIRFVNNAGQPDEAVIMPVRPGTTEADLARFFSELELGWDHVTDNPLAGFQPLGMPVIHPGQRLLVQPDLLPGEYVMFTWLLDLESGSSRAAAGMFKLITVNPPAS